MPRRAPIVALAFACVVATGPAGAQAPAPAPAPQAEERLTPNDQRARVQQTVQRMRELAGQVDKLSAQARSERDIVKLNCVNEKLAQVRGLLRVSEQAEGDLREAQARRDDDGAQHATTKAQIAAGKVAQLRQEAEQCIGQLAYFNDEKTQVEVEVPAGITDADPTQVPWTGRKVADPADQDPTLAPPLAGLPGLVSRPPPASGF